MYLNSDSETSLGIPVYNIDQRISVIISNELAIRNLLQALSNPEIKERLGAEKVTQYYDIVTAHISKTARDANNVLSDSQSQSQSNGRRR